MAQAQDHMSVSVKVARPRPPAGAGPSVATHDDPERRLTDAVQLQVEHPAPGVLVEQGGLALSLRSAMTEARSRVSGPVTSRKRHGCECPTDGPAMGGGQHPLDEVGIEVVRAEPSDIATGGDDLVESLPFFFAETPCSGVGGSLGRRGCVPHHRDRSARSSGRHGNGSHEERAFWRQRGVRSSPSAIVRRGGDHQS